jgi:hypothetical protein
VRVIECGEDLSFLAEAAQDEIGVHAAFDELDGGALVELVIDADCFVHCAHAAASDLAFDAIRAETAPEHRVFLVYKRVEQTVVGVAVERMVEHVARAVVLGEEHFDVSPEVGVSRADLGHVPRSFFGEQIECGLKDLLDLSPAFGGHDRN